MSFIKKDRLFPSQFENGEDPDITKIIAESLRNEYQEIHSAIKVIGQQTGAHPRAIRNWYEGINAPNCSNLVVLAQHTPVLLKAFLDVTGHKTVWEFYERNGNRYDYAMRIKKFSAPGMVFSDRFVTINVTLDRKKAGDLNQRQLWFLSQLQAKGGPNAEEIAQIWGVTLRSARRDIAGLIDKRFIRFTGCNKTGFYELI